MSWRAILPTRRWGLGLRNNCPPAPATSASARRLPTRLSTATLRRRPISAIYSWENLPRYRSGSIICIASALGVVALLHPLQPRGNDVRESVKHGKDGAADRVIG